MTVIYVTRILTTEFLWQILAIWRTEIANARTFLEINSRVDFCVHVVIERKSLSVTIVLRLQLFLAIRAPSSSFPRKVEMQ